MYNDSTLLPYHKSAVDFAENPSLESSTDVLISIAGKTLIASTGMLLCGYDFKDSILSGLITVSSLELFSMAFALSQK